MTVRRLVAWIAAAATLVAVSVGVSRGPGAVAARPAVSGPPIVVGAGLVPPAMATPGPRAVSLTFVAAYVAFVYGRLAAAALPSASAYVRHQADGLHPHPLAAVVLAADPRLRSLRLVFARHEGGRAVAVAVIRDRSTIYQLRLDLRRRRPGGWTITGLGESG